MNDAVAVLEARGLVKSYREGPAAVEVLRGIDYTFAGVFSIFAVKILMTHRR